MKNLIRRIGAVELRMKPMLEEKGRKPIGIALGIDPEDFLEEFDRVARIGQLCKFPGVPIKWLLLSGEERLNTITNALYRDEMSGLSRTGRAALLEILELMDKLEDNELESEMKQPDIEGGRWFMVADYVRDGRADTYSTNDDSLILTWAYSLARAGAMPNIIRCFETYTGHRYDPASVSFYSLPPHNRVDPQPYDTGELEDAFELTRLRIAERPQRSYQ